jgi:hypothetical protein
MGLPQVYEKISIGQFFASIDVQCPSSRATPGAHPARLSHSAGSGGCTVEDDLFQKVIALQSRHSTLRVSGERRRRGAPT